MKRHFKSIFTLIIICLFNGYYGPIYAQNIFINEFLASNVLTNPDNIDFDDYSDWIELYNGGNSPVLLDGYFLTDNLNNPTKWQIPAGAVIPARGFLRIWADGFDDKPGTFHTREEEPHENFVTSYYHTNFSLSVGGEEIGLYNPQLVLIDSVIFDLQLSDVSYGRMPNGSSNWVYFGEPTPGASNGSNGINSKEISATVNFSVSGGIYTSAQSVVLSSNPSAPIHYTIDGSMPNSNSMLYTSPININQTNVIRARVFENGKLPGPIATESYLINTQHTLPVLSMTVFPEALFGSIGIYDNQLKSREVPVSVEFFETDKQRALHFDAGLRLSGQASFQYPQKPLTISTDDRFGTEEFKYRIFKNRSYDNFTSIYLRNSGTPDNRITLFRDALQHTIVINKMDVDLQAYRPAVTYLNGQYWGIYNLREKVDAKYLQSLHNIDPDNLDYLEYDFSAVPVVEEGDADHYNALIDFVDNNDMSLPQNYEYVKKQVDINEFLNYLIAEIYCNNINWPNTNSRFWRERNEKGKWRWIMVDFDWGFGTPYNGFTADYTYNAIANATSQPGTFLENSAWSTILIRKLLQNGEFKNEFIQRFASHLNTTFAPSRVVGIVDSLENQLLSEMQRHIDRWNDNSGIIFQYPPIPNLQAWQTQVNVMRIFGQNRTSYQRQHIIDFFQLTGSAQLTLNLSDNAHGKVFINNVYIPGGLSGTYFKDIPLVLKAVPKVGYRFSHWQGLSNSASDSISLILTGNSSITAVFEEDDASILPDVISGNMVLTAASSPYLAKKDVLVSPGVSLVVEAGVEIQMPQNTNIFVNGNIQINGTENNKVVIRPNSNSGAVNWGALIISNATGNSNLSHLNLIGATKGPDTQNHIGAISSFESDITLDDIEITDAPFPVFTQYGNIVVRNSRFHSDKISDCINVKYASSALIENCDFRGNNSFDSDAIDYDQLDGGIIRGNRIYNFIGFNSDGIDLGEGSKNILIEDNLIFNINDKGISVGQKSTTIIKNNVIVNCGQGVGVKDEGSYANIQNNTFYGCDYSVASFEKNFGVGGGHADVINSIIAQARIAPIFVDNLSILNISYSLSDTEELDGMGNIQADPLFNNNFRLGPTSPAINTGDPASPADPDGSLADMGAIPFNMNDSVFILINEIHYNPHSGADFQFVELYNNGNKSINLSGYHFSEAFDYTFLPGSLIDAGEYIVVARNAVHYENNGYQVFQDVNMNLKQAGNISLKNSENETVDLVSYSNKNGWIEAPDGSGYSLELIDPSQENLFYANWRASENIGGTPGQKNSTPHYNGLFINEFLTLNDAVNKDENNEFDDWIEIYNGSQKTYDIGGLYLTDNFNNPAKFKIPLSDPAKTTIQPGGHLLIWADQQPQQGVLHADIALNGNGEEIAIVQIAESDTIFIDSLTYTAQQVNISFGRKDDGSSQFVSFDFPTPGNPNSIPNAFKKGILLVNGISFETYGDEVVYLYNQAFPDKFNYTFWDCFNEPAGGYAPGIPEPIGHGAIPSEILTQYSTVLWVGNNYAGDLDSWNATDIKYYLERGGNLLLASRLGQDFINPDLRNYLGIEWVEQPQNTILNCVSTFAGLHNISFIYPEAQTLNAVFSTTMTTPENTLLFMDTQAFSQNRGLGVWRKPVNGGAYKKDGGQFVFLSGRPYRYNPSDLRYNFEYILTNFFVENDTSVIDTIDPPPDVVRSFKLMQNYPNPFNGETKIEYDLLNDSRVLLKVYNIRGQEVRTLVNGDMQKGHRFILFDALDDNGQTLSSGIYFYRIMIEASGFAKTRKLLIIK